jgi:hypothetical protein
MKTSLALQIFLFLATQIFSVQPCFAMKRSRSESLFMLEESDEVVLNTVNVVVFTGESSFSADIGVDLPRSGEEIIEQDIRDDTLSTNVVVDSAALNLEEVIFVVFSFLRPSELKNIPLVCKSWDAFSKNKKFSIDCCSQFKPVVTPEKLVQNTGYFIDSALRLEISVSNSAETLMKSPCFFNLAAPQRKQAENILCEQYRIRGIPLCLIRRSSIAHQIVLSFINEKLDQNTFFIVEVSPRENSININTYLNKDQKALGALEYNKKNDLAKKIYHTPVNIRENDETKQLEFFIGKLKYESLEKIISEYQKRGHTFLLLSEIDFNSCL